MSAPHSFIFRSTHAKMGDSYSGIIGPEVDHVGVPNRFVGRIQEVSRSVVTCGTDKKKFNTSNMVYGVSPSGAGTISVGTMMWVERGLTNSVPARTRSFVTQVTENLLSAAAIGPLGLRHPIQ